MTEVATRDVMTTTDEGRVLDREVERAQALYARLTDTEAKIKAAKERNEGLIAELGRAELASAGRPTPQAERLRKALATTAAELEDLENLDRALRIAVSAQREQVDRARAVVDRLRAEAGAVEWRELFAKLQAFSESEGARALREAIVRTFRNSPEGAPRAAGQWLPIPKELERMRIVTEDNFGRLRKDGYEV